MTVATLTDVLAPAIAGNYAVAGLVVLGWEDAQAYVEAAEELGVAVILQAGPGCRAYMPVPILGKMFRTLAEQASIPVVCHIDHAYTVEECLEGIECGFTSVMIDGSRLSIEANIALTARVAELAHRAGVSVEGEVGQVGYVDGKPSAHTSPEDAARFDRQSAADAMAISIGNVHLNAHATSEVDMATLRAIEAVTTMPLVIHGGSGLPASTRHMLARETRIKKFNIGTELRIAFGASLRASISESPDEFDRNVLLGRTIPDIKKAALKVLECLRHS